MATHDEVFKLATGRVLRLSTITDRMWDTERDHTTLDLTFKADGTAKNLPKDKKSVFVCLLIGVEPLYPKKPEDQIDIDKIMDQMGWMRKPTK